MYDENSRFLFASREDASASSFTPKEGDKNFNKMEEISETPTHKLKKEVWTSLDGTHHYQRSVFQSKSAARPPNNEITLENLKVKKQQAIEAQDYETAAKIRDEIKRLESK